MSDWADAEAKSIIDAIGQIRGERAVVFVRDLAEAVIARRLRRAHDLGELSGAMLAQKTVQDVLGRAAP